MKLLILRFEDGVDLAALPWGTEVTVSDGTTTVTGKVVTPVGPMEAPPTLEGIYHIAPIPPAPEEP